MTWFHAKIFLKKYIWVIVFIVFFVISALRVFSHKEIQQQIQYIPTVRVLSLTDMKAKDTIMATGIVESENQITIRSEVHAPVSAIFANIGEAIAPGTPILTFEHVELSAQLAQAQAGIQMVQAQLAVQTAPPRSEDIRQAELSIEQARVNLESALANREKVIKIDRDNIQRALDDSQEWYTDGLAIARSISSDLRDALVLTSDYQDLYFTCSNESVCHNIRQAKESAIFEAYDISYAGSWSSSAIQQIRTGIIHDLAQLEKNTDPVLLHTVLTSLRKSLHETRRALIFVREGLDTYPPAMSASATDRATIEAKRIYIDTLLSTIDSYFSISIQNIEDARIFAEQNKRIADANVHYAENTLRIAETSLQKMQTGARAIDLGPLYAQLAQANAAYDLTASSQRRYFINAPFAGEVISMHANLGESIAIGQPIVTIANPQALELSVFISADDRQALSRHAVVRINDNIEGIITSISSGIDAITGNIEVRVAIIDSKESLVIGEHVSVTFEKESNEQGIQIPLSSVKTTAEGTFVFSPDANNVLAQYRIKTGSVVGNNIWVTFEEEKPRTIIERIRGLKVGDTIKLQ